MNPVDKIRDQHRNTQLQQLLVKSHRSRIMHLYDIRSMGIITLASTKEEKEILSLFLKHMTQNGSTVRVIEMPANIEQILDKYGLPKQDLIKNFTSYHYDLLIDATPTDNIFGLYVTLSSSSYLRVAYQDITLPTQDITVAAYDLIIRGNGPMVLSSYLTDLLDILMKIRKKNVGTPLKQ